MPCICTPQLGRLAGGMALPPFPLQLPPAVVRLAASVSAAANASASAQASAMAQLQASLSASAMAKISALASAQANLKALGVVSLAPPAMPGLASLIQSANEVLAALKSLLAQNTPSLNALGTLAGLMLDARSLGVNLASPQAAGLLQAKLSAAATASASASAKAQATASAQASASVQASASLQAAASASAQMAASMSAFARATAALGLPLSPPDPLSQLANLLRPLAVSPLPAFTAQSPTLAQLMGMLASLVRIQQAFGLNMMGPVSASAIAAATGTINLNALAKVAVSASATAAASAKASASAQAAAAASFAAKVDAVLAPVSVQTLAGLASVSALAKLLKSLGAMIPTSPCAVCTFLKPGA